MAKFCNQCGKPLQDGEVCSCQSQTVHPTPNVTPSNAMAEQVTRQV